MNSQVSVKNLGTLDNRLKVPTRPTNSPHTLLYLDTFTGMTTAQKLPRGTRRDSMSMGLLVERSNKEKFAEIARNCGMTASGFFDYLVEHMPLDDNGRPVFIDLDEDGRLPLDAA